METEIEAKFPNIDPVALRLKLKEIGATLKYPEVLMKRNTFDFPDRRLYKENGWVRVRDERDKVTLSYKQQGDRDLYGTKEITVTVDDFGKTVDFLLAIGMEIKAYKETKREKWKIDDVEVTIDTWPWIPSFVELEGPNEKAVKEIAARLGFDWSHTMYGSIEPIYQMHYDVTEEDISKWELVTFTALPEWLEAKQKKKI